MTTLLSNNFSNSPESSNDSDREVIKATFKTTYISKDENWFSYAETQKVTLIKTSSRTTSESFEELEIESKIFLI